MWGRGGRGTHSYANKTPNRRGLQNPSTPALFPLQKLLVFLVNYHYTSKRKAIVGRGLADSGCGGRGRGVLTLMLIKA